mgnify:FL=1
MDGVWCSYQKKKKNSREDGDENEDEADEAGR